MRGDQSVTETGDALRIHPRRACFLLDSKRERVCEKERKYKTPLRRPLPKPARDFGFELFGFCGCEFQMERRAGQHPPPASCFQFAMSGSASRTRNAKPEIQVVKLMGFRIVGREIVDRSAMALGAEHPSYILQNPAFVFREVLLARRWG